MFFIQNVEAKKQLIIKKMQNYKLLIFIEYFLLSLIINISRYSNQY